MYFSVLSRSMGPQPPQPSVPAPLPRSLEAPGASARPGKVPAPAARTLAEGPVLCHTSSKQLLARKGRLQYCRYYRKPPDSWLSSSTPGCPRADAARPFVTPSPTATTALTPARFSSLVSPTQVTGDCQKQPVRRETLVMLEKEFKAALNAPTTPCQPQICYRVPPRLLPQTRLRHGPAAEWNWGETCPQDFTSASPLSVNRSPPRALQTLFIPLPLKFCHEF